MKGTSVEEAIQTEAEVEQQVSQQEDKQPTLSDLEQKMRDIEAGILPGQVTKPWLKGGISPAHGVVRATPVKITKRQQREKELLSLLRKIKPTVSEAIYTAVKIMRNEEAAHSQQLRAATILLDNYRKLTLDLAGMEEDEVDLIEDEVEEVQDNSPVFSLKIVGESSEVSDG